jgi:Mn-dependent DtxR family transcriptional regulator
MARYSVGAEQHIHNSATRAEHFIDSELQEQLAVDLDRPATDPHGRTIPPDASGGD